MKEYHKIETVFKRDPETKHKHLILGDYSLPEFEYLKTNKWIFTEKVDGTNIRIIFDPDCSESLTFKGRSEKSQIPSGLLHCLNDTISPLYVKFTQTFYNTPVCFYGEGYGANIQPNGKFYKDHQCFVLFDIKMGDFWLQRDDIEEIAKSLGIGVVPVIGEGSLIEMVLKAENGFNSRWGNFQAEGIVARPAVEFKTRNGGRLITKIKCKDFKRQ